MKRKILMAGTAMLIAAAAFAGNGKTVNTCCKKGSKCEKVCAKNCDCSQKNCSPANCTSKDCSCKKQ